MGLSDEQRQYLRTRFGAWVQFVEVRIFDDDCSGEWTVLSQDGSVTEPVPELFIPFFQSQLGGIILEGDPPTRQTEDGNPIWDIRDIGAL